VMMAWRAITMCGRFMFADLLGGGVKLTYTADELGGQDKPELLDSWVMNPSMLPETAELAVLVQDADVAAQEQASLTIEKPRLPIQETKAALAAAEAEWSEAVAEQHPPSFSELTHLLGTFPEWKGSTADGLERNVRRLYELMQGLGLWEIKPGDNADPFHAGLARFGDIARRDPAKWGVEVEAFKGDPLQHWGSLGKKSNQQAFAAITVFWAENRLEKGKP
jgi:hypothetical protein